MRLLCYVGLHRWRLIGATYVGFLIREAYECRWCSGISTQDRVDARV